MHTSNKRLAITAAAILGALALSACQAPGHNTSARARNAEFNCIAGTVGGAVIGGLLGSTIGGGSGRTIATAAGIGAGGYVGNRMGCD